MVKVDHKKEYKDLYNTSKDKVKEIVVPEFNFLMIDGIGDPNKAKSFAESIEALYSLAYTIKFYIKKNNDTDYSVMPLEGLWWADNMIEFDPIKGCKDNWKWTIMVMQPEFITEDIVKINTEDCFKRKKIQLINNIRFEKYNEGKSVQILHIGSYSSEEANIFKLHEYIKNIGAVSSGKHHEIYLSDARRTSPDKLKTIVRQPFSTRN